MGKIANFFFMTGSTLMETATSPTERLETTTKVDDDWFDGDPETYEFEVEFHGSAGTQTVTAYLREKGETTNLATLSLITVVATTVRATFTYPASPQAAKELTVWLEGGVGGVECQVHSARIIVKQTGAITKRATEVPLGTYCVHTSASYNDLPSEDKAFWLKEESKFDGTITAFQVAVAKVDASVGNNTVALSKDEDIVPITNTTTEFTSTSIVRVQSAECWGDLVDGEEYQMIVRGADTITMHTSKILIIQENFTKALSYKLVGKNSEDSNLNFSTGNWTAILGGSNSNRGCRTILDESDFSGTVTSILEATGESSASGSIVNLIDIGTSDTATSGTSIANSPLSSDNATARLRTSGISYTDGNRYITDINIGGLGSGNCGIAWVIYEMEDVTLQPTANAVTSMVT